MNTTTTTAADAARDIRYLHPLLAARPGAAVSLTRLREVLAGRNYAHSRAVVDAALLDLADRPDVILWAEADQKRLDAADRAAAIRLGGTDRHLLLITG
ncbi:hypothetical protein [Actinosynnema sp. NPDC023587]|uniref:hypothetical protein n=1 Tax=Actinosynnema sp. NPDC023587 TaxID=3154695 RepID=UPI003403A75A